jgi:hypothetical protein
MNAVDFRNNFGNGNDAMGNIRREDGNSIGKWIRFARISGWISLLFFGLLTGVSRADIYSWTDENGVQHFSNRPPKSASAFADGPLHIEPEIIHDPRSALDREKIFKEWQRRKGAEIFQPSRTSSPKAPESDRSAKTSSGSGKRKVSKGILEIGGFEIDATAHQTGPYLRVRGRVRHGPYCGRLRLFLLFQSPTGQTQRIATTVADVGGTASRIIRHDLRLYAIKNRVTATWELVDADIRCVGN